MQIGHDFFSFTNFSLQPEIIPMIVIIIQINEQVYTIIYINYKKEVFSLRKIQN